MSRNRAYFNITLKAYKDADGDYCLVPFGEGPRYISRNNPALVKVEQLPRELPTRAGTVLLIKVEGGLHPLVAILGLDGLWTTPSRLLLQPEDFLPDWVEINPSTLRPIDDDDD